MLQMKNACESCNTALLLKSPCFICSYECTFCPECSKRFKHVCPNCRGELVARPKRNPAPTTTTSLS